VFLDGSGKKGAFTQKDYLAQILTPHIESILEDFGTHTHALGLEPLFMEDGNSAHGHKSTQLLRTVPYEAWDYLNATPFYES